MSLYAKHLIYTDVYLEEDIVVADALSIFRNNNLRFVPVLSHKTVGKVLGFVSYNRLLHLISTKYGYALYQDEKMSGIMETEFLCMDIETEMMDIVSACMSRPSDKMYDDIVITEDGFYSGLVSIKDIVTKQMEHIVHKNRHIDLQNQTLKEADYQVKQTESKYKLLFENGVNAVIVVDMDGLISQVNSCFCQMTGFEPENIEHTFVLDFIKEVDRSATVTHFLKVQKNYYLHSKTEAQVLNNIEFRLLHKNGSERVVETAMRYLPQTKQVLCSFNDITEKKYFEEKLRQSEKLSAVGSMLTGITHELNNQLTPILGYADLILMKKESMEADAYHQVEVLRRCAVNATNIVSTLLRYAKPKQLNLKMTDLNRLISENIELLRYHDGFRNVHFEMAAAPNLPLCKADEHQIGQVLVNMFINAIQAMEQTGGTLKVTTSLQNGFAEARISDTGKGIAPANLSRIFEPFFTTKSPDKGTGLGLSVSYSIVKAHGGDIQVESELGKGTTFTIKVPVYTDNLTGIDMKADRLSLKDTPPRMVSSILLVEDDKPVREMTEEILKEHIHCRVTSVSDGRLALDHLDRGEVFDLVLSDIRMPHVDGIQLFEWITRNRPELSERFIFVTGDTYDARTREFLAMRKSEALYKPFELSKLIQVVNSILQYKTPTADTPKTISAFA
jgi:PAS domain S-box-containing protein